MTPSIFISCAASGDGCGGARVDLGFIYSMNGDESPGGRIGWFGRNLRASGFGVFSVWMKMLRLPLTEGGFTIIEGWCKGCKVGRVCAFEAAIAGSRVL